MERKDISHGEGAVPGTGGAPVSTGDGQQGLRLHAVIAAIAFVLCAFVAVVFFSMGSVALGVVFAVIALVCVAIFAWALRRRHAGGAVRR
jgi:Flp pilus assembly protein TadB